MSVWNWLKTRTSGRKRRFAKDKTMLDLIYSGSGNQVLLSLAHEAGWLLGARSDRASYGLPLAFVDIDYKAPDFRRHLHRVSRERPRYAIVPDLSETAVDLADIRRALAQADELAAHCEVPLIVPKLAGQLAHIPAQYAIAYSIPSSYGGATFGPWKLAGRRVHLLGGSPSTQRRFYRVLRHTAEVMSADGNMAQKCAGKLNYWSESNVWRQMPRGTTYRDCLQRSLENILRMWQIECGELAA